MKNRIFQLLFCSMLLLLLAFPYSVEASKKVIPMGQSIGISLNLNFVYVANDVLLESGDWLKSGMIIEQVDHQRVTSVEDVTKYGTKATASSWTVANKGRTSIVTVTSKEASLLYPFLKDKTDGIGTLTYVDPDSNEYGALGHQIIDESLQKPPHFVDGSIFLASIHQIKKSVPGKPGYKMSAIADDAAKLGNIENNALYGVFGKWHTSTQQSLPQPLEIMQREDIVKGDAIIYTAIEGSKVEPFTISITEISNKSLKFEVTDRKLLQTTGGILQGMSGSPIIQNGQFLGAVTHMYVDEPEKGAAIPLVEMMKETSE